MNPINEQFIVIKSSVVAGDPRTNYYYKEAYLPNSEVKLFKPAAGKMDSILKIGSDGFYYSYREQESYQYKKIYKVRFDN